MADREEQDTMEQDSAEQRARTSNIAPEPERPPRWPGKRPDPRDDRYRVARPGYRRSRAALIAGLLVAVLVGLFLTYTGQLAALLLQPPALTQATPAQTATPFPTATLTPRPTATLTPRPTATPNSVASRNAQMGCAVHLPRPEPVVVYNGKYPYAKQAAPHEVALTFDDGPTPYSTPSILSFLERTHTPATFFVEGNYAQTWPNLIAREWRDGFAIGVHTWDHPDMTLLTPQQMRFQLGGTLKAIHNVIGADACIWFWRPPYGNYNAMVLTEARNAGLTTVMWDVDPQDWSRPGTQVIADRVMAQVHPGAIIILHDGPALREQTAAALPQIVAGLKMRGYTLVTLPKLLADGHYPGVSQPSAHP
jgi:chitooligosaccharide deacetylase